VDLQHRLLRNLGIPRIDHPRPQPRHRHHILETIALRLDGGDRPDLSLPTHTLIPGAQCFFLEVSPQLYSDYVGFARWFYRRRHFPLYQVIWPNNDGLYPWDTNAPEPFKEWQPVLGEAPRKN
jgi:hypothetical protein